MDADTVVGLTEIGSVTGMRDIEEIDVVNPSARAEIAVNPDSELIPVTRANGLTHVLSVPSGGLVSGSSALIRLDGWTWEDLVAASPVALHVRWPSFRIRRSGRGPTPPPSEAATQAVQSAVEPMAVATDAVTAIVNAEGSPYMIDFERGRYDEARRRCANLVEIGDKLREGSEAPFAHALAGLCRYALDDDDSALDGSLEALRVEGSIPKDIGYDVSAAAIWRPKATQNIVFRLSGVLDSMVPKRYSP